MNTRDLVTNGEEITTTLTDRTNDLLHMILDLKQNKEVDLYAMQKRVLDMYRDGMELYRVAAELERELESRKRKVIEIPIFMSKKEKEAQ